MVLIIVFTPMPPTWPVPHRSVALAIASCGALLFALSLGYFLYRYLVSFGVTAAGELTLRPILWNVALFTIFAFHHSLLARPALRAAVGRIVPPMLERSLYTWTASLLFIMVCAWWQPLPGQVYRLTGLWAHLATLLLLAGLAVTAASAARLDILDLAGLRAVLIGERLRRGSAALETGGLYAVVRHPVYLGWVLLMLGTPSMTTTRLLFAVVSTLYLVAAVPFEEASLIREFGDRYRAYQRQVRWRIVPYLY